LACLDATVPMIARNMAAHRVKPAAALAFGYLGTDPVTGPDTLDASFSQYGGGAKRGSCVVDGRRHHVRRRLGWPSGGSVSPEGLGSTFGVPSGVTCRFGR
jgi:hypothetical protein